MTKVSKLIFLLLVGLFVTGGALWMSKDILAQSKLQSSLRHLTGLKVDVEGVQVTSFGKKITIDRINIFNPEGYSQSYLGQIENVKMDMDPIKLLKDQSINIHKLEIDVKKIYGERTAAGKVNLREFKTVSDQVIKQLKDSKSSSFLIEKLELNYFAFDFREMAADGKAIDSRQDFQGRKDVFSQIRRPEVLIFAPLLKVIGALERGSLGIPRHDLQLILSQSSGFQQNSEALSVLAQSLESK